MSEYIKREWVDGEAITADKMNNIETGIAEAKKEAMQGEIAKQTAQKAETMATEAKAAAEAAQETANSKAPAYTYGTEDIEAGSASTEPNGTLHFVYE